MQPEHFNYQASQAYQHEQQERAKQINAANLHLKKHQRASIYRPALHALGKRLVKIGYALQGEANTVALADKTAPSM